MLLPHGARISGPRHLKGRSHAEACAWCVGGERNASWIPITAEVAGTILDSCGCCLLRFHVPASISSTAQKSEAKPVFVRYEYGFQSYPASPQSPQLLALSQ